MRYQYLVPLYYERYIEKETSVLMILENWENNGTEDIWLVTSPLAYNW